MLSRARALKTHRTPMNVQQPPPQAGREGLAPDVLSLAKQRFIGFRANIQISIV